MSPCDLFMMLEGYHWREDRQRDSEEAELYLLRHIAFYVHNALSKKGNHLESASDLLYLPGIDADIERTRQKQKKEQKKRFKKMFERAKERGNL